MPIISSSRIAPLATTLFGIVAGASALAAEPAQTDGTTWTEQIVSQ